MEVKMDYIQLLKGYVEGVVSVEEFQRIYCSDLKLQKYLNDNLPSSLKNYAGIRMSNGDINEVFKHLNWGTAFANSSLQDYICRWLKGNGIIFNPTSIYTDRFEQLLEVMPDYIEGMQAEALVEEIIKSIPYDLAKAKRNKLIKEKIKEAFHLNDGKRPYWVQGSDWPFSKTGKPLKYISKKTDGELAVFIFKDMDTEEITEIKEYS